MSRLKLALTAFCVLNLTACSLFSSQKTLPAGERVAVIEPAVLSDKADVKSAAITLLPPQDISSWPQLNSSAAHVATNVEVSDDLHEMFSASFAHGSSRRNFLLARPIIDNNMVYTQNVNGAVYAFDIKTGNEVFRQEILSQNKYDADSSLNGVGLASDGKKIYALTGFGTIAAIDALTGEISWRQEIGSPCRAAPTIGDRKVFIITIDNRLLALNLEDGSEVWNYSISSEDTVLAGGASAAYDDKTQTLVVPFSNGEIMVFNARLGYPLFSHNLINFDDLTAATNINAVKASPVISEQTVIAIGNNRMMLAFDIKNGDILWRRALSGIETPLVYHGTVYLITQDERLIALDLKDGSTLWQVSPLSDLKASERAKHTMYGPIMVSNRLIVTDAEGVIYAFNPKNGALDHRIKTKQGMPFAPIAALKTLVVPTNNADLIFYR